MSSEEALVVETPEQVRLEFPLADLGSRGLALAIDLLAQAIALTAVGVLWSTLQPSHPGLANANPWMVAILVLIVFVVQFGYFAAFEALMNGQTPGKLSLGLRVIRTTGRPIEPRDALTRNLVRLVDDLPGLYGVGVTTVMLTSRRQRLGDLAAGTVVVHERTFAAPPATPPPLRSAADAPAMRLDVLTPDELLAAETFLQRRESYALRLPAREHLARELATRFARRLGPAAAGPVDPEAWIERLAYHSRMRAGYR